MIRWAWQTLWADRAALVTSALGVGLALLLALLLEAIFAGEAERIVAFPDRTDADVWVMQDGVSNMHMATSLMGPWAEAEVREVEGVAAVTPMLYLNALVDVGEGQWFAYVIGVEPEAPRGGPWALESGEALPGPGEAVIPSVLSAKTGIGLGATIEVLDHELVVVGLADEAYSMANSIVWVPREVLADLLSAPEASSYLMVQAAPGVEHGALAQRIRDEVDGVNAMARHAFVESDRALAMHMGADVIELMTAIGSLLGGLVLALSAYASTARHRRELALVRALGVGPAGVLLAVAAQTVVLTALGALVAVGLALVLEPLTAAVLPEVSLSFEPATLLRLLWIGLLVALVAALVPVRAVLSIDPADAFRA